MTESVGLPEFLRMESFWIKSFVAPGIREEIRWTSLWLTASVIFGTIIWIFIIQWSPVQTVLLICYSTALFAINAFVIFVLLSSLVPRPGGQRAPGLLSAGLTAT